MSRSVNRLREAARWSFSQMMVTSPVSLLDLAPTFIHAGEAPDLPQYDGQDLYEILYQGKEADKSRHVVSVCSDIKGDAPSAMVRQGRCKFVEHAGYAQKRLFDLVQDPGELVDLGTDSSHAETVRTMEELLHRFWKPEEELEKLRQAKVHFQLMKKWHELCDFPLVGEWRGNPEDNYLI